MVYITVTLISIMLAYKCPAKIKLNGKKIDCAWLLISSFPFFLISAFRYDVGTDYMSYISSYFIYGGGVGRKSELFSVFILKIAQFMDNPYIIIFIHSAIFCFFVFGAISDQSENRCFSILLISLSGFFFESFNIIRQASATAVFLYSLKYLQQDKISKKNIAQYMFGICSAILLHKTAFLYLVFTCIFYLISCLCRKGTKKLKFVSIVIILLLPHFIKMLRNILFYLSSYFGYYNKAFYSVYDTGKTSGSLLVMTIPVFVLALFSDYQENDKKYLLYYSACYSAVFCALIKSIIPNGERIIELWLPVEILSIPYFVNRLPGKLKNNKLFQRVVYFVIFAVLFSVSIYYYYFSNTVNAFPYQFII